MIFPLKVEGFSVLNWGVPFLVSCLRLAMFYFTLLFPIMRLEYGLNPTSELVLLD